MNCWKFISKLNFILICIIWDVHTLKKKHKVIKCHNALMFTMHCTHFYFKCSVLILTNSWVKLEVRWLVVILKIKSTIHLFFFKFTIFTCEQLLFTWLFSWGFYFREFRKSEPRENFPFQFMSIYSNENIRKITKLSPREFPHLVQNRENIYAKIMAYTVAKETNYDITGLSIIKL